MCVPGLYIGIHLHTSAHGSSGIIWNMKHIYYGESEVQLFDFNELPIYQSADYRGDIFHFTEIAFVVIRPDYRTMSKVVMTPLVVLPISTLYNQS